VTLAQNQSEKHQTMAAILAGP